MLKYISLLFLCTLLSCSNSEVVPISEKDVEEDKKEIIDLNSIHAYRSKDAIKFPHAIHTDVNKIECKYCHAPNAQSKNGEVTTENNCTNCHKKVSGH